MLSLLILTGTAFNLSKSILPISAFKLVKSNFAATLDLSTHVSFFRSNFVA